jgi:SAM-dependent methyltransferase
VLIETDYFGEGPRALPSFDVTAGSDVAVYLLAKFTNSWNLASHLFSSMRKRGIWRTAKISLFELYYETKFRIRTGFVIPTRQIDGDADALRHATDYFPSSYLILHEALLAAEVDYRNTTLVDYGCGFGRALLFASTVPFRRIIGVELSPSLSAAATANMSRFYHRLNKQKPDWVVVNSDARTFNIPDDANLFYFFNPFDASVLANVIDRIISSVRHAPRTCTIIYANPLHEVVLRVRGLKKMHVQSADFAIYCLEPIAFCSTKS